MKQRLVPALSWEVMGGDAVRIKLWHLLLCIMINPDKSETLQGTHPVPHILSFTWTINPTAPSQAYWVAFVSPFHIRRELRIKR